MARGLGQPRPKRTNVTDGDMSRLPLWAQNSINYLKRDLEESRARFASLGRVLDDLEDLKPGIAYGSYRQRIEIPKNDKVVFWLASGQEVSLRLNEDATGIYVQASDALELHTQASNTMEIMLRRDRVREKLLEARASEQARAILLRPSAFDGSYEESKKS